MVSANDVIDNIMSNEKMYTVYVEPDLDKPGFWKSCNTLWLKQKDAVINDEGKPYTIEFMSGINGSFQIKPVLIPGVGVFKGDKIRFAENNRLTYIKGSHLEANNEFLLKSQEGDVQLNEPALTTDVLPLVWFVDRIVKQNYGGEEDNVMKASNVLIYFLDNADNLEWSIDNHYNLPIKMMQNIASRFKELIDADKLLTRQSFQANPTRKFGITEKNGNVELIIDAFLSGYEVLMDLDIRGCNNC